MPQEEPSGSPLMTTNATPALLGDPQREEMIEDEPAMEMEEFQGAGEGGDGEVSPSKATEGLVDSAYSWLILLVGFMLNLLMNAVGGGLGVLLVELTETFDVKRVAVVSIGGVVVSVGFLLSFLLGWLVKKFGSRRVGMLASLVSCVSLLMSAFAPSVEYLYLTYGFMLGVSSGFYFTIASIIVQQYFDKRRSLAQGTLMAGLSAGLFIWPPVTRLMIDGYGWRGTMILHAGLHLHGVPLCALIRPHQGRAPPERSAAYLRKSSTHSNASGRLTRGNCGRALFKVILLYPHYLLYMAAVTLAQTGNVMPYTLTPLRAQALGIEKHLGALVASISAGISGIFRVLCGMLGDVRWVNRLILCGVATVMAGTLTALSVLADSFGSLVTFFSFIAIPSAGYMSLFGSVPVDLVGRRYLPQAIGLMAVSFGVAQLTTFLVTGWLCDLLGDPKYAFLVFGVAEALGGVLFLVVFLVDKRFKRHLTSKAGRT